MRRARAAYLAIFAALSFGLSPGAAGAQSAPDFGAPPSGEYPILFNDHHVYTKPDTDRQGRVLTALVRGKTILVPLRSMFEQMGAEVSYDAATRTAIVSKPGSEIQVTVGKPEVIINGESRPLDVPPEIFHGAVLVPVRVISEAMGAYVQWVAEKRAVVIRYVPLPPPTPAPTQAPPPPPAATQAPAVYATFAPTPAPLATPFHDLYAVGDISIPRVYNDFVSNNSTKLSYNIRAAGELASPVLHLMFEGNFNRTQFNFPGGLVVPLSKGTSYALSPFSGFDDDVDVDFGMRIMQPRIYFIEGYFFGNNNYGYPNLHGLGYGIEKLPDLNRPMSFEARFWYSASVKGPYAPFTAGATMYPGGTLTYRIYNGLIGADITVSGHIFADVGWQASRWDGGVNAPGNRVEDGPYVGLGGHF